MARVKKGVDENRNPLATPVARGVRVREIREKLLRYSRSKFCLAYGVPAPTLQNWEVGKYGGLTPKGARKLVKAFGLEGLVVGEQWLMFGEGDPPKAEQRRWVREVFSDAEAIAQELDFFQQLHADAVCTRVSGDEMNPVLLSGDWVAGIPAVEFDTAVGDLSIVQLRGSVVKVGMFQLGQGGYRLIYANPSLSSSSAEAILGDEILSVAPVIWIRRERRQT